MTQKELGYNQIGSLSTPPGAFPPNSVSQETGKMHEDSEEKSSGSDKVTLDAIKGLLKETLGPLTSSVSELRSEFAGFKHEIKEEVHQVKTRVGKMEDGLKMTNIRMKDMENKVENIGAQGTSENPSLVKKIEDLEKSIQEINLQKSANPIGVSPKYSDIMTNTLVMGGLKVSLEAATQWANKVIGAAQGILPREIYKKGAPDEAFKGLMFLKFSSCSEAASALGTLQAGVVKENIGKDAKNRLWVDFEAPIEQRVCDGFLIDLRKQLIQWEFPSSCIEIVKEVGGLKVAGKNVVQVEVVGNEFRSTYVNEEWAKWPELQDSAELKVITGKAKDRLAKSRAKFSKGIGKGAMQ